jgi:hypothetical protein
VSGNDRYAPVQAQGWLYKLAQGVAPARSALKRTITAAAPTAYWALEDGLNATQAASGVPGGMAITSTARAPLWASDGGVAGSDKLPLFGYGATQLTGQVVNPPASATVESFECVARMGPGTSSSQSWWVMAVTDTTLGISKWMLILDNVFGNINLVYVIDSGSSDVPVSVPATVCDDLWHHYRVLLSNSGADTACSLYRDGVLLGSGTSLGHNIVPAKLVQLNIPSTGTPLPSGAIDTSIGHAALYTGTSVADHYPAFQAYVGEMAHVRAIRLGAEDAVPVVSAAIESMAMGAQGIKSLLDLLRECEATDQGFLYEGVQ